MKTKAKIEKRRANLEARVKALGAEPRYDKSWFTWRINRENLMGQLRSIDWILG